MDERLDLRAQRAVDERLDIRVTDADERIRPRRSASTGRRGLAIAIVVLAIVAAGVGYVVWDFNQGYQLVRMPVERGPQAPPPASAPDAPSVRHPLESAPPAEGATAAEPAQALPQLADSDRAVHDALAAVAGAGRVDPLLNRDAIVRRIVATLDNLPREKATIKLWPIRPASGQLAVTGTDARSTIAPKNATRYTAYVALAEAVEPRTAVDAYVRLYPLFQRAYEELGYPNRYFNDRVIEAIDDLLASPELEAPAELTRSKVLYEFADPSLESRSAGQKIMLRIGPDNAKRIKARLREIRRELVRREASR